METLHALPSIQVKNILFATDFSPAATSAAAYAAEIAKHYGAKLFAFHVRPPVISSASWTLGASDLLIDKTPINSEIYKGAFVRISKTTEPFAVTAHLYLHD
jgi:Universal stress protein family